MTDSPVFAMLRVPISFVISWWDFPISSGIPPSWVRLMLVPSQLWKVLPGTGPPVPGTSMKKKKINRFFCVRGKCQKRMKERIYFELVSSFSIMMDWTYCDHCRASSNQETHRNAGCWDLLRRGNRIGS